MLFNKHYYCQASWVCSLEYLQSEANVSVTKNLMVDLFGGLNQSACSFLVATPAATPLWVTV